MPIEWDTAAWERGMEVALKDLELKTEREVLRLAVGIEAAAKGLCPVLTGNLRRSISHEPGRTGRSYYVDVGTNVIYAPFVEFGTKHMRAQPFLRPAFLQAINELRSPV